MRKLLNIALLLAAILAPLQGAANETLSAWDVTESLAGSTAVSRAGVIAAAGQQEQSTQKKGGEKMSNNNVETFVIEPMVYKPTAGPKPGKFVDMGWDATPKANGAPRKDLVVTVELEEKDSEGNPIRVSQAFNFLPRGRGKSDFKKQLESFLEAPLTPAQLAGLNKDLLVGKPVIVNYKTDHLGHVVFDKYTPVKPAEPTTVQPPAPVPTGTVQPATAQPPTAA